MATNEFGVEQKVKPSKKVLQDDSAYAQFDADGDGIITDEEMRQAEEIMRLEQEKARFENEDAKEDQIRAMAWFALWGMLLYPILILVTSILGQEMAAELISNIAPTYFVAIAGLVAAFFGAQAYSKQKPPADKAAKK